MSTEEAAYWKERYFTLLNEGEKRHEEQNQYESMLSRAVVRLTLATSGLDPRLDPHLQSIREAMRKGQASGLGKELDALLDSLIRVPKSGEPASTAPTAGQELLRFLEAQCVAKPQRKEFEALKRRFESGSYAGETDLFKAAARLLRPAAEDPAPSAAPEPAPERAGKGVIGKLFGRTAAPAPASSSGLDCRRLRQRLDELLQALPPPEDLAPRVEQLRAKLADEAEDLVGLFDAAASLISEMGAQHWNEQKQLCDFLASLSGKLGELEAKALRMDGLNESSASGRRATEALVAGHVADLRADASKATDLAQLRSMISLRLDAIACQMDAFRTSEETRYGEAQTEIRGLTQRLKALEQESEDLRNRLILANRAAYIDPLTKLPNRNAYLERIDLEEKRWRRFHQPLSLVVWDIDLFKQINDRFGHASGDKALALIGNILAAAVRNTDFVARFGGEEFVMLLIGADEHMALDLCDGIRVRIEDCEFTSEGRRIAITMSCGISQFKGKDAFGDVFERADRALYQAKRKGRNRCEIASDHA